LTIFPGISGELVQGDCNGLVGHVTQMKGTRNAYGDLEDRDGGGRKVDYK